MTYRAPVNEMLFMMRHVGELDRAIDEGIYPDLSIDLVENVLEEASRFSADVLAPINRPGDRHGAQLRDGVVTTAPGFKEAYQAWIGGGWNALAGPAEYGGQDLPLLLNAGCSEMWNGACLAFGVAPLLTFGGVEALAAHGNEDLKQRYLEKLVAGEWTATMNLTEPHAGSDLSAIRSRAEPRRRLSGLRAEDLHQLRRARPHRQHRPSGSGAIARRAEGHARNLAVPGSEGAARRQPQRRALFWPRAQTRNPREPNLHDDLRRRRRRARLAARRGTSRTRLHVHHDEQRAPLRRAAGCCDRRARLPGRRRFRRRTPPRRLAHPQWQWHGADYRARRRAAHAGDDARPDQRRTRDRLRDRSRDRPLAPMPRLRRAAGGERSRRAVDPRRQGVRH